MCIAPQGQSPLSYTMEGWAGPEKAEGWVRAWSSPLELPQPSPRRCCCCRHPVSMSHPSTALCPPTAAFHIAPCWAPSAGKGRISLSSWSTSLGVVWTAVKEGQQEQSLYLLPKIHPCHGAAHLSLEPGQERRLDLQPGRVFPALS